MSLERSAAREVSLQEQESPLLFILREASVWPFESLGTRLCVFSDGFVQSSRCLICLNSTYIYILEASKEEWYK